MRSFLPCYPQLIHNKVMLFTAYSQLYSQTKYSYHRNSAIFINKLQLRKQYFFTFNTKKSSKKDLKFSKFLDNMTGLGLFFILALQ